MPYVRMQQNGIKQVCSVVSGQPLRGPATLARVAVAHYIIQGTIVLNLINRGMCCVTAVIVLGLTTGCASTGNAVVGASRSTAPATAPVGEVNQRMEEGPGINLTAFFRNPQGALNPSPAVDDAEYAEYLEWKRWQEFKAYLEWQRQRQSD